MGEKLTALLGTLGSWLGSIAAHVLALVIAPIYERVRERNNPTPTPTDPLEAPIRELAAAVRGNSKELKSLKALLKDRLEPPR
ncbi:MAG: hypothetical protein Q9184_006677, partial [Pyrenodesmia sp. 2 TL-2023]